MVESSLEFVGRSGFATPGANAKIDIVFVHGLGGHPLTTWASNGNLVDFWPKWLAEEFAEINVWTAGYDSGLFSSALSGEGCSLADCSTMLRDFLVSKGLGTRPILFITHSLGGLVVKQMLRRCGDSLDPNGKTLLAATAAIAFIGTPHQGSGLASIVSSVLGALASKHVKQLAFNDEGLLDLHNWFRNWATADGILVAAYFETDKMSGMPVVNKSTADPGLAGCDPTAVKGNHVQICKPDTRESQLYLSVAALVRRLLSAGAVSNPSTALTLRHDTASLLPAIVCESAVLAPPEAIDAPSWPLPNPSGAERGDTANGRLAIHRDDLLAESPPLPPELLADYEFFTTVAPEDRRPLDEKLTAGGRAREIGDAKQKKERFAMSLRRYSAQASSLGRYTRLMSDVEARFRRQVRPLIDAGATEIEINRLVQDAVIDPALKLHRQETDDVSASLVESALYYLTGNCHVRWDADED